MVRSRPQHTGRVIQVAIVLNVDGQAAIFLVRECSADGSRRAVADAVRSLCSDKLVVLREIP